MVMPTSTRPPARGESRSGRRPVASWAGDHHQPGEPARQADPQAGRPQAAPGRRRVRGRRDPAGVAGDRRRRRHRDARRRPGVDRGRSRRAHGRGVRGAGGVVPGSAGPSSRRSRNARGRPGSRRSSVTPTRQLADLSVEPGSVFVALYEVGNPGNLGTIIRTADSFGVAGVVLIGPSADPYAPAAVKASMGSLFALPIVAWPTPTPCSTGPPPPGCRRSRRRRAARNLRRR